MPGSILKPLKNLTLSQKFALASLLIILAGMAGIGAWVQKQIEKGVIHRAGAVTALYVDSFVAPNLQELGWGEVLQPEHEEYLRTLLQETPLGRHIVAFKVWDTRGRLLYSTDDSRVGKTYPMHEGFLRARLGDVSARISQLDQEENKSLGELHAQLLETYSPVWYSGTDEIIAVAEFYQRTDELQSEIAVLKRQSWLVVGLVGLGIYLLLSVFVRRVSDTIDLQQRELERRVAQLTDILGQNQELHDRVRRAAASVALLNESYLRRVGSELHDGPAQDLGLSILKLDAVIARMEERRGENEDKEVVELLTGVEGSLQNALKEMRGIAAGLSLPQLVELELPETVVRAVRAHERQTGTQVNLELASLPQQAALPLKITVYRLIQEALNNAFRHAGGKGQNVRVHGEGQFLVVEVSDTGEGFDVAKTASLDGHLGLRGMRERVESLGGTFRIASETGKGTRILAHLPWEIEGEDSQ